MMKIISMILTLCFSFTGIVPVGSSQVMPLTEKNIIKENLSVSSRFQPPVLVEWNETEQNYKFYDHTEQFAQQFKYKSSMAYVTALFGQFLKEQERLQSKELKMSDEGLRKRFQLFRSLIIENKKNSRFNLPDLNYKNNKESKSLRLENNKTIWVSCEGSDKDSLYFYCFYLKKTEETEPYVFSLPVSSEEKVICKRVGPFSGAVVSAVYPGLSTMPKMIFELFRSSIFEFGSEVSLIWDKEVNSRCVIDFYRYLKNETEGFTELIKKEYFKLFLTNILISTVGISSSERRREVVDVLLLENNQEERAKKLASFHIEQGKALADESTKSIAVEQNKRMVDFLRILRIMKKDFMEDGLNYEWITFFEMGVRLLLDPEIVEKAKSAADLENSDEEMEAQLERAIIVGDKLFERITKIVDNLKEINDADIDVLYAYENKIKDMILTLLTSEKGEVSEILVDKYLKELWTIARKEKVKYFFPTDDMIETAVAVKISVGKSEEVPEIVENLFHLIERVLYEGVEINNDLFSALYSVENSINRILSLFLRTKDLAIADLIADKYLNKVWTLKMRKRTMNFLPGEVMSRLIAAIKFTQGEFDESCKILEEALANYHKNKRYFDKDSLEEFELNALVQLGEGYLRMGQLDKSEKTLNKLKEKLAPLIRDKQSLRKRQNLYTWVSMIENMRDIALIKNDYIEALNMTEEIDLMVSPGNVSLSKEDISRKSIEYISRIDLSMRLWGMSDDKGNLSEIIESYRKMLMEIDPNFEDIKAYDGWIAFRKGQMDVVRKNIEALSKINNFTGKEYVIFLHLCKVTAAYYANIGEQENADRIADIGIEKTGRDHFIDLFSRNMFYSLEAEKKGHKYVEQMVLQDLSDKKYSIEDMTGIMCLLYLKIAIYEQTGDIPEVFNSQGKMNEVYNLFIKILGADYKAIAQEFQWNISPNKKIFIEMMRKLLVAKGGVLTPREKLNLLFFLGYVRETPEETKWLVARTYELKEEVVSSEKKTAKGKKKGDKEAEKKG